MKCRKYLEINGKKIIITKENKQKVAKLALELKGKKATEEEINEFLKEL